MCLGFPHLVLLHYISPVVMNKCLISMTRLWKTFEWHSLLAINRRHCEKKANKKYSVNDSLALVDTIKLLSYQAFGLLVR